METKNNLEELAARLVERITEDIKYATHREEHIRVTARANEAAELLDAIRTASANGVIN
jgi:hypothetical protein